jgi:hypothetical protein
MGSMMAVLESSSHFLTFENTQDRVELFKATTGNILVEIMPAESRRFVDPYNGSHSYSMDREEQAALREWLSK